MALAIGARLGAYEITGLMLAPGDEKAAAKPTSIVVVQNFTEELKERVRPSAQ